METFILNNRYEDPVAEVHRIRAELLEEYGGIKGYLKHLDEDRPRLEKEGWRFAGPDELAALRNRSAAS
jgi:hypothetical protein